MSCYSFSQTFLSLLILSSLVNCCKMKFQESWNSSTKHVYSEQNCGMLYGYMSFLLLCIYLMWSLLLSLMF